MRPLLSRYPSFYLASPEFVDLQSALEPEVEALWGAVNSAIAQLNVETATWGLKYWEQTLGISVDEARDPSFRRSRIKSKIRGAGVTTVAMIQSVAEAYSNGAVTVSEYPEQFAIEIKFVGTIGIPPNMDDLTDTLREILPAHLQWTYIIVYNTHQVLSQFTHTQLATKTQLGLRTEALSNGN